MGEKKPSKFTVDDLSDVTVFRELEKMKKFILDNIYGKLIAGMQFDYGGEEEPNKVTLTITFNDETSVSASFEMNTIENITTELDGDILYLIVTMTNGASYRCPIDTSEFVTIGGNQTVTGDKLFTGDVQVPDIEHEEGEEQIQETNKAVNERTLKIYATERIDSLEDEMGDVGQEGTVRGDLATLKNDMTQAKEDIVNAFDDIRYLDENKQTKLVGGTNIKNINNHNIMGGGNIDVQEVLESGTNIKTINSQSLLGSGDIIISGGGGIIPTSFNQLWTALYNKKIILLATKFTYILNGGQASWTIPITNIDQFIYTTAIRRYAISVDAGSNFTNYIIINVPTSYTDGVILAKYCIGSESDKKLWVIPSAFNGGSLFRDSTKDITINESNYETYIDLSQCLILG